MPRLALNNQTQWGSFDYDMDSQSRTSYRAAHRHVLLHQPIHQIYHCRDVSLPQRATDRNPVVSRQTYRTSSAVHGKFTKSCQVLNIHERAPTSSGVRYLAYCDDKLEKHSHGVRRQIISETKENFRKAKRAPSLLIHASCGHSPLEIIPNCCQIPYISTEKGQNIHADPYLTTSMKFHSNILRESSLNDSLSNTSMNDVTIWSNRSYPKVAGYGFAKREIWMPNDANIKHAAWGNENYKAHQLDKTVPRPIAWMPRSFTSETKLQFTPPMHGLVSCRG